MTRTAYLYRIQPTRPDMLSKGATPEEDALVTEHFLYLQEQTRRKVVLLAGRTLTTDTDSFGIVIFTASSEDEAARIMEEDPAVQAGVFRAQLFPFRVALISEEITKPLP
ncbi:MAG: hypothetical protein KBD56_00720 [Candidatus Eisenbacteria bacterium]|nr:hypothetical protein [Candidatus Eisenbacteria bacterium]